MAKKRDNPEKPSGGERKGASLSRALDVWQRNSAGPEYAAASFRVLSSAGKVTRQKYLEMLLDMEENYPGRGWKEQMDELERFYFKYGLKLSERPRLNSIGLEYAAMP